MKRAAAWALVLSLPLGACDHGLVGGQCLPGYVEHDGICAPEPVENAPATPTFEGLAENGGAGGGAGTTTTSTVVATGTGGGCGALTQCGDACFDLSNDPAHCGDCGNVCPTGLCAEGACEGAIAGHIVVLGVDVRTVTPGTTAARLLGNAVFLSSRAPLRIIDYRVGSDPIAADHVEDLVAAEAQLRGRTVIVSVAPTGDAVESAMTEGTADLLLLHVPAHGHPAVFAETAAGWAAPAEAFGASGGVVVALANGATSDFAPAFLCGASFLPGATSTDTTAPFEIASYLDALSIGIASPFAAPGSPVTFEWDGSPPGMASEPIVDGQGRPVAVHRIVTPSGP